MGLTIRTSFPLACCLFRLRVVWPLALARSLSAHTSRSTIDGVKNRERNDTQTSRTKWWIRDGMNWQISLVDR